MTQQHNIAPPPKLVQQWMDDIYEEPGQFVSSDDTALAARAAQWGADQELEACCEWLESAKYGDTLGTYTTKHVAVDLGDARRPKLKEQALALLNTVETSDDSCASWDFTAIRRALEQLP